MKKIEKIDQELHAKFSEYGTNAKLWMRKCVMMLPEIEKRRIWEKKGFSCIYEYAAKLAGMGRGTVDDALWMLRKLEDKPELMKVAENKGLNAVRPVVSTATIENDSFWAGKAKIMSRQTLATYVKDMKNQELNGLEMSKSEDIFRTGPKLKMGNVDGCEVRATGMKKVVAMELKPEVLAKLEKLKGKISWNELMEQLLNEREEKLEAKKPTAVRAVNEDGHVARHIPMAIKRHVLAKTNGQCAFPECTKPAKILHHTERFETKKYHDQKKIAPLCVAHERIAHLSLIENEENQTENWKLRKEPDQNTLNFWLDHSIAEYRQS